MNNGMGVFAFRPAFGVIISQDYACNGPVIDQRGN